MKLIWVNASQLTPRGNRRKQEAGEQIMADRANDNPPDPAQMSLALS